MKNADYWIEKLEMLAHPEGGYFKEIYRASEIIDAGSLPNRYSSNHSFSTSIYFLLKSGQVSKFHRIKSDEIWHFYSGSPIIIYNLDELGNMNEFLLGEDFDKNQFFQVIMKANNWFAAHPLEDKSFSLVGCTVAPGFEFEDFELASRNELLQKYPQHKEIIIQHT